MTENEEKLYGRYTTALIICVFLTSLGAYVTAYSFVGEEGLPFIPLQWGILSCIVSGTAAGLVVSRGFLVRKSRYFKNIIIGIIYMLATYWAVVEYNSIRSIKLRIETLVPVAASTIILIVFLFIQAGIFNQIEKTKNDKTAE